VDVGEQGASVLTNDWCNHCGHDGDTQVTEKWDGAEVEWWCLFCGWRLELPRRWVGDVDAIPYLQASV
jgi:hypothetical protein